MPKFKTSIELRNKYRQINYNRGVPSTYVDTKRRWNNQELLLLEQHLILDRELATMLNRTVKGIQVKRSKVKYEKISKTT